MYSIAFPAGHAPGSIVPSNYKAPRVALRAGKYRRGARMTMLADAYLGNGKPPAHALRHPAYARALRHPAYAYSLRHRHTLLSPAYAHSLRRPAYATRDVA